MAPLTSKARMGTKALRSPEDASFRLGPNADRAYVITVFKYLLKMIDSEIKLALEPKDEVERVRRCHRNDLEHVFNFLAVIGIYYLISGTGNKALPVYAIARFFHSFFYLNEIRQPFRAISNTVCNLTYWFVCLSLIFTLIHR